MDLTVDGNNAENEQASNVIPVEGEVEADSGMVDDVKADE